MEPATTSPKSLLVVVLALGGLVVSAPRPVVVTAVSLGAAMLELPGEPSPPYVMVHDLTPSHEGKLLRVHGWIAPGTIRAWAPEHYTFTLQSRGRQIGVSYTGPTPDVFKDQAEVIVRGRLERGALAGEELVTKCASTYERPRSRSRTFE